MELLTGQCKKDFQKWLDYDFWDKQQPIIIPDYYDGFDTSIYPSDHFNVLPLSMQWGVFVDFFDSVGIRINIFEAVLLDFHVRFDLYDGDLFKSTINQMILGDRGYTRTEAVSMANELYNKKHINNIEVQHEEIKEDE